MHNILLLGGTGQVGQALLASQPLGYFMVTPGRAQLNFCTTGALAAAVAAHRPALVINCVAYNQVDGAEAEPERATQINYTAVAELASACDQQQVPLIHFSTDYVFPGKAVATDSMSANRSSTPPRPECPALYREADAVGPVNQYGLSKLRGEQAALASARNLVLRVSWVFSEFGQNMGQRIVEQVAAGNALRMAHDQFGSPTYAGHIAETVWALVPELIDGAQGGLYHLSGTAAASRFELAEALLAAAKAAGLITAEPTLTAVSQQEFIQQSARALAPRPQWSALGTRLLAQRLGRPLPHWREGLALTAAGLRGRWPS